MKNEINTLVVCSKEVSDSLKEEILKISTEVKIKYTASKYKEALDIINDNNNIIDAIIIDVTLEK